AEQTKSDIARTAPSPWKTCPRIISTPSASTCNVNTPWDLSASARLSKRNCHAVQDRRKSGARAKSLQIEARKVHSDLCFDECLNEHWFPSLLHARTEIERWRREYNEERPKRALGGLTPAAYAKQLK